MYSFVRTQRKGDGSNWQVTKAAVYGLSECRVRRHPPSEPHSKVVRAGLTNWSYNVFTLAPFLSAYTCWCQTKRYEKGVHLRVPDAGDINNNTNRYMPVRSKSKFHFAVTRLFLDASSPNSAHTSTHSSCRRSHQSHCFIRSWMDARKLESGSFHHTGRRRTLALTTILTPVIAGGSSCLWTASSHWVPGRASRKGSLVTMWSRKASPWSWYRWRHLYDTLALHAFCSSISCLVPSVMSPRILRWSSIIVWTELLLMLRWSASFLMEIRLTITISSLGRRCCLWRWSSASLLVASLARSPFSLWSIASTFELPNRLWHRFHTH